MLLMALFLLGGSSANPEGGCVAPWSGSGDRLLGNQAPNFKLSNLSGEKVELSRLVAQKPTLLVFWATWCPTCVEEIPTLNDWVRKYPQMQILSINVEESRDRVKNFSEKRQIQYPVLLDSESQVAEQYGLVGIPATVLVSKGGRIVYYGFSLPENIETLIKE